MVISNDHFLLPVPCPTPLGGEAGTGAIKETIIIILSHKKAELIQGFLACCPSSTQKIVPIFSQKECPKPFKNCVPWDSRKKVSKNNE